MKINVTNGQGIIRILFDNYASCLVIKKAIAVNWPDSMGSVGEYFSVSDYQIEERNLLSLQINKMLIHGTDQDIMASLSDFLNLFSDGKYRITVTDLDLSNSYFNACIPKVISGYVSQYEAFSGHLYPNFSGQEYFYTLPSNKIDPKRVDYYIDIIKKGEKPKAIIYDANHLTTGNFSSSYVLDGHHKIEAYIKLKLNVPVVYIHKLEEKTQNTQEIISLCKEILNPVEFEHFLMKYGDDLLTVDFRNSLVLTKIIDDIIRFNKYFNLTILRLFVKYNISDNIEDKIWLNERLINLSKNIYIGKGLILLYKKTHEYGWFQMDINNITDYELWKESLLALKEY